MVKPEPVVLEGDIEKSSRWKKSHEADSDSSSDVLAALIAEEEGHDIKFRTLSWQKATLLLFGEYVCLAILALPWSFSVLGWGTGLVVQIFMGLLTWYTSYILWQWCMKHPDARDICEIAAKLFPNWSRLAYEGTAVMLLLNNILLIGFHIFTGARILNTLSDDAVCTVGFQGIAAIMGIVFSLPRTLKHVSVMSIFSAVFMGIAIILSLVYSGIEAHPGKGYGPKGKYPGLGPVKTHAGFPDPDLTFVNGLNAVLNITFLWIGQILYPSFIAEMRRPQDFPKALAALTALEMILFLVVSVVGYHYLGQYAQAPLVGSFLEPWQRKSAFAFVIVPTVIIGAIYSNVTSKFIYRRILGNSRHAHSNTATGWGVWVAIIIVVWALGFVFGNVIPSMGDFLAIISAAFDSFFGFIFWAVAYWRLNRGRLFAGPFMIATTILNVIVMAFGLFMLGPGLYTSIEAIIDDYSGSVTKPFSCTPNSL